MSSSANNFLAEDAKLLQIFHYTLVSTVALLIYDYMLTLNEEIRFMWSRRMTLGKVLFFLNRYLPFVTSFFALYAYILSLRTDIRTCREYHVVASCLAYVSFLVALAVQFMRAYAVWASVRAVHVVLVVTYVVFLGVASYVLFLYIRGATPVQLSELPLTTFHRGCVIFFANNLIWIDCVLLIVCETLAVSLLIGKSISNYRHSHPTSGILGVMVRDGVGYFVCNIAITTINVVVLRRTSAFLRDFLLITQGVLENILCNRLLLHIYVVREASMRRPSASESTSVELRALPKRRLRGAKNMDNTE